MKIARMSTEILKLKKEFWRVQKWSQKIPFPNALGEKSISYSYSINNKLVVVGRSWRKCATIQMSVQAFRIHGNVADFDVNPGPKAFWSNHVRKALHNLSFWKCFKSYQNWISLAIIWKDFDTIMVLDQISESHLFQKNGFTITWIEIVIRHRAISIF